jgi:hypothetical protein
MYLRLFKFGFDRRQLTSTAAQACGRNQMALLADMDHVSPSILCELVHHLDTRFDVYFRRAYGVQVNGQIHDLGQSAIKPVATFPSIQGKAATDMQLVLDALEEIEHADAYCIASRDGDFASLIQRLREKGKYLVLAGPAAATSVASRQVANEFIDTDSLLPAPVPPVEPRGATPGRPSPCHKKAAEGEHNIDGLVQELKQTLNLLAASLPRPTLLDLEAAHIVAHPQFKPQNHRFLKGTPPQLTAADNFVDLIRSTKAFCIERVPTTSGAFKNYYLQFRK